MRTKRFSSLQTPAPADARDSEKVFRPVAMMSLRVKSQLCCRDHLRASPVAQALHPCTVQPRAAQLGDMEGKAIHACEGHKRAEVAKQQSLVKQAAGHMP